jgi:hypothetical protein
MVAAREERRRNRSRIDYSDWDGGDEGMGGDEDGGGGRIEDPYDGHLNAEELSRSLLDLITLYGAAAAAGVRGRWGPAAARARCAACAAGWRAANQRPLALRQPAPSPPPPQTQQLPTPNAPEFVSYYLLYLGATFGNFRKKPDELTKVLRSAGPEVQVRFCVG